MKEGEEEKKKQTKCKKQHLKVRKKNKGRERGKRRQASKRERERDRERRGRETRRLEWTCCPLTEVAGLVLVQHRLRALGLGYLAADAHAARLFLQTGRRQAPASFQLERLIEGLAVKHLWVGRKTGEERRKKRRGRRWRKRREEEEGGGGENKGNMKRHEAFVL
jgi:hypothetical protein